MRTLIVAVVLAGGGCTDSSVKAGRALMAQGLCADAVTPLKEAMGRNPSDKEIAATLCQAMLCTELGAPPEGQPRKKGDDREDRARRAGDAEKYCVIGAGAGPGGTLALAFLKERRQDRLEEAGKVLAAADKKSAAIDWYSQYTFGDSFLRKDRKGLAPELGKSSPSTPRVCPTTEKAREHQTVFARRGAPVFEPGGAQDGTAEAGAIIQVTRREGDKVFFSDRERQHWRKATGWVVVEAYYGVGAADTKLQIGNPYQDGLLFRQLPRESFKFAEVHHGPNDTCAGYWRGVNGQTDYTRIEGAAKCKYGGGPAIRPGSLRGTSKRSTTEGASPGGGCCGRVVYEQVTFDEKDEPERYLLNANTISTPQACSGLATVYKAHPEWPDSLFEALAADGELRPGTPEGILQELRLDTKGFYFDRDDLVVTWTWRDFTVTTRNGRVHADK